MHRIKTAQQWKEKVKNSNYLWIVAFYRDAGPEAIVTHINSIRSNAALIPAPKGLSHPVAMTNLVRIGAQVDEQESLKLAARIRRLFKRNPPGKLWLLCLAGARAGEGGQRAQALDPLRWNQRGEGRHKKKRPKDERHKKNIGEWMASSLIAIASNLIARHTGEWTH